MTKRNPFDEMNNATPFSPAPESVVAMIPTATQKKRAARTEEQIKKRKASRAEFDKKFPCYPYHIPEHLHSDAKEIRALILGIAQNREKQINVTEIDMTTKLVSWSLEQVRKGKLLIKGFPNIHSRKMTVVVEDAVDNWDKTPLELKPGKKRTAARRLVFTYRFPSDVITQINSLAGDTLPKGEVLIRLLQYAVEAYKRRIIKIRPSTSEVRQSAEIVETTPGDSWN
jgi:hypothetical protein